MTEKTPLEIAREAKAVRGYHKNLMGDIGERAKLMAEALQKHREAGTFDGYEPGTRLLGKTGNGPAPFKIEGHSVLNYDKNRMAQQHFETRGIKPSLIEHGGIRWLPMLNTSTGKPPPDGKDEGGTGDWSRSQAYLDTVKAANYPVMGAPRIQRADGGRLPQSKYLPNVGRQVMSTGGSEDRPAKSGGGGRGDGTPDDFWSKFNPLHENLKDTGGKLPDENTGLYSKNAVAAMKLKQEKGTVDQMLQAMKNHGMSAAEMLHSGRPLGNTITKLELAEHFHRALPKITVHELEEEGSNREPTKYGKWKLPGGHRYREHLLTIPNKRNDPDTWNVSGKHGKSGFTSFEAATRHAIEMNQKLTSEEFRDHRNHHQAHLKRGTDKDNFKSNHWDQPNVLAHLRLQDRLELPKNYQNLLDNMEYHLHKPVHQARGDKATKTFRNEEDQQKFMQTPEAKDGNYIPSIRVHTPTSALQAAVQLGDLTPEEAATVAAQEGLTYSQYHNRPGVHKKVLHVDEVQSDWGQAGAKKLETGQRVGFYSPDKPYQVFNPKDGVVVSSHATADEAQKAAPEGYDWSHASNSGQPPEGPYVTSTGQWTDLALKHVLHEAAHGDYDKVVFTPGDHHADRYNQTTRFTAADLHHDAGKEPWERGTRAPMLELHNNGRSHTYYPRHLDELHDLIGPEHAAALLSQPEAPHPYNPGEAYRSIQGDFTHGGEGMKKFYDEMLPKAAMKQVRLHDPSIQPETTDLEGKPAFGFSVTPQLRDSVKSGQSAFQRGGMAYGDGGTVEHPLEGMPTAIKVPKTGQLIIAKPSPLIRGIARNYMKNAGLRFNPSILYDRVNPERGKRIAEAYDQMKDQIDHPLVRASYEAMIKETKAQYLAAKRAGFKAEFWDPEKEEDPYGPSPRLATEDVINNHHMFVYPTESGYGSDGPISEEDLRKNPLLGDSGERWNGKRVTNNDLFRAVHDYYGHAKEGVGFRHDGEENAWRSHAAMFSPLARMAMTSETRGQNSYLNFGPHGEKNQTARTEDTKFSPQKLGIMPLWTHHEGAEDFITPEDHAAMRRHMAPHKFSIGGMEDGLIGHHNLKPGGVEAASNLGGIPMPSMAISKVAHPLTGFGNVSLLTHPGMVLPSKDTNVWSGDAYTGRQPRGDIEWSNRNASEKAMKADPHFGHMGDVPYWLGNHVSLDSANEMMKIGQKGVEAGIDPKKFRKFYDFVDHTRRKLGEKAYEYGHLPGLGVYGGVKHVLYPKEQFRENGDRIRPSPYTLAAVMRRMREAKAHEAAQEGFMSYGAGAFRAAATPKFRNADEVKAARNQIIPGGDMSPHKVDFENAYTNAVVDMAGRAKHHGFEALDRAGEAASDIVRGRHPVGYPQMPDEVISAIKGLGKHAASLPTEYFEAKAKKAIPLSAFPAALVPKDAPDTVKRLTEAGVKRVLTYGSPEERLKLFHEHPDLMFKKGGAVDAALKLVRKLK